MQSEDEDDEFLFESSHLALRSNTDYQKLLRHLTVLCAQRIKIHEDIIQLRSMSKRAIEGPLAFVEDFQNDRIVFPTRTEIPGVATTSPTTRLFLTIFFVLDPNNRVLNVQRSSFDQHQ